MTCALQPWVSGLTMMQQSVLMGAVRGPDGIPKYGPVKSLVRWYRRSILLSAIDGRVLSDPYAPGGGSFTGPSLSAPIVSRSWRKPMDDIVSNYLQQLDSLPHHFHMHFMHAVEVVGYKHPDLDVKDFWGATYLRFAHDMHLWPETEDQLDGRLGDCRVGWLARSDPATSA